jgi:hypothetical protein
MKHPRLLGLLALCALALTGCGKTSSLQSPAGGGPSTASDDAAVASSLQSTPEYVNESVWEDESEMSVDSEAQGFAAITPLRFARKITNVETDIHIEYSNPDPNGRPTVAHATIQRHLQGSLHILAAAEDTVRISKPIDDDWTRKIVLVRRPVRGGLEMGPWRLAGTSGVDVRTRGGSTRVLSLRVQAGAELDTTITDPLELHRLRRIIRFLPGAEVQLTATTEASSDVVLFHGHGLRRRFTNNGDGTHSFRFPAGEFPGLRHFGVDAMSHGTLFDDTLPYDANAWILGYAVVPVRLPAEE